MASKKHHPPYDGNASRTTVRFLVRVKFVKLARPICCHPPPPVLGRQIVNAVGSRQIAVLLLARSVPRQTTVKRYAAVADWGEHALMQAANKLNRRVSALSLRNKLTLNKVSLSELPRTIPMYSLWRRLVYSNDHNPYHQGIPVNLQKYFFLRRILQIRKHCYTISARPLTPGSAPVAINIGKSDILSCGGEYALSRQR